MSPIILLPIDGYSGMELILSLDGYEGSEDEELILFAVRAILLGTWFIGKDELDIITTSTLNPGLDSLSLRERLCVDITAELLKPVIEPYIRNRVKPYATPPMVKVRKTRFDLFLEFA